jgi:hypothetical protein
MSGEPIAALGALGAMLPALPPLAEVAVIAALIAALVMKDLLRLAGPVRPGVQRALTVVAAPALALFAVVVARHLVALIGS